LPLQDEEVQTDPRGKVSQRWESAPNPPGVAGFTPRESQIIQKHGKNTYKWGLTEIINACTFAVMKRKFNKRAVVSVILFVAFILMPVSGKMIQWFERGTFWGDVGLQLHALSAGIFIVAGIFHIIFNWKQLKSYIHKKRDI
jgi:hypothetical protein